MTSSAPSNELAASLARVPDWQHVDDALVRELRFADFPAAFAFLTAVALIAERQGHHPEITNVYRDVTLRLRTHDAGNRVTTRDVELAAAIDSHLSR